MKRALFLLFCLLLLSIAACSQNAGKKGGQVVREHLSDSSELDESADETEQTYDSPPPSADIITDIDASILALYKGITLRVTDRKTQKSVDTFVPFMTPVRLKGTPLTVTATHFFPDFVMSEGGYATRSTEPKNPGAKVKVTGGATEFDGWLFANFPEAHPYDDPDYNLIMLNAVRK